MSRDQTRSEPYGGRFTKEAPRDGEAERLRKKQVRRAMVAGTVGTSIEWYDFFLYGTAAALVFPHLFFPGASAYAGALASFATYAVGFAARPVGAAIFGHFGDRIGRKATLISTLMLMGIASTLIGVLPGYATLGFWAPTLLVAAAPDPGDRRRRRVGRLGDAVHGVGQPEAPRLHRQLAAGRRADRPAALHGRGLAAHPHHGQPRSRRGAGGCRSCSASCSSASGCGSAWACSSRRCSRARSRTTDLEDAPLVETIKREPREIILSALLRMSEQAPFYIFTAFVLAYGTEDLGFSKGFLTNAVMVAAALSLFSVPFFGHLSDVIGRKRMYMTGAAATMIIGVPYFLMLDSKVGVLVVIAIVVSLIPHDMQYGPQAALIAESFPTRRRYSGAGLGYQLASVFAGGPAPLLATWLLHKFDSSLPIGIYIAACGVVTLIATALLPEPNRANVAREFEQAAAAPVPKPVMTSAPASRAAALTGDRQ